MEKNDIKDVIGIDLGTTFSCVGIWESNQVKILQNQSSNTTTPSIVSFIKNRCYVGISARNMHSKNIENTIYDTKRLIGKKFNDPGVQKLKEKLQYKIIKNEETGEPMIKIKNPNYQEIYYIDEISQIIISELKNIAEIYSHKKIKDAVITVPAYFNELQRERTKIAAETAGLNILRIINEPTAAAIAYGLINENQNMKDRHVLIFDLGGGTFDVTILLLSNEGIAIVKSTNGDSHLGGEDFTNKLVDFCVEDFLKNFKIDLKNDPRAMIRLRNACEDGKIELSEVIETYIEVDGIANGEDLNVKITRTDFEEKCNEYFKKCINCVKNAIKDANLKKEDIEDIVLVGGSSRIPKIQQMVKEFFNREELCSNVAIHPDEAIAIGATYLANVIKGNIKDESLFLLDIIGMSLGIEIAGGKMEIILKKGTNIPFSSSKIFTTNEDNQESISFNVYQGDYEDDISKNYLLNEFCIDNIKKGKAGKEVFEVTFTIDPNSCLIVSAKNIKTGENIVVKKIDEFSRLNEKKYKKLLENNKKRDKEKENLKINLNNKINLMTLLLKEKEKDNPFADDLIKNLNSEKNDINDELFNLYLNQLYPDDN